MLDAEPQNASIQRMIADAHFNLGAMALQSSLKDPGTYLSGFYETRPLPYAEPGYGYPRTAHTIVNATNGKILRLLVDDEPFDLRYGHLHSHERVLDLRAGVLCELARTGSHGASGCIVQLAAAARDSRPPALPIGQLYLNAVVWPACTEG